ncbi:hypothetical protein LMH87_003962 [Akanthomyces muscarius]|uniref:N-acetyltransferase domain-containing protein n=1 Tax=Akanthomyces muscarius TaxID=2231603 RepID=A0A9W8Q5J5_AKAMU|nr:hypothetical protein LMH87_003962 [Akanthomyces muscarius]KAJ4145102.1 hypothetical protein LMH87_003962 [Akanthomyces muscarius]
MPISIRKAVAADIPFMGALDLAGYRNSPFRRAMFPPERRVKPGDGDALEWFERGAKRALGSTTTHYIVALEDEGSPAETVVGMAVWGAPQTAAAAATQDMGTSVNKAQGVEAEPKGPPPGLPSYIGYERVMEANKEIHAMLDSQDTLDEKARSDMWNLDAIVVDERHRRKGIGKALVQWGIDQASREGRKTWLIATSDGKKLYDAMGFAVVGSGSRCGEAQHIMVRSAT